MAPSNNYLKKRSIAQTTNQEPRSPNYAANCLKDHYEGVHYREHDREKVEERDSTVAGDGQRTPKRDRQNGLGPWLSQIEDER